MKAIVTGMIATYGIGGVAWDYGQYALGLERLGYDVHYLEDTGEPPYDPNRGDVSEDYTHACSFLAQSLGALSPRLASRWRIVGCDGRTHGLGAEAFARVLDEAVLFLNVSGSALMRDEYLRCRRRVLIDTDPGWNHFRNFPKWDAAPGWQGTHGWRAHDHFFTYALRLGRPDCPLPDFGIRWHPTLPPVVRDRWQTARAPGPAWTTIMSWNTYARGIAHEGRTYGAKEREFPKLERVPKLAGVRCAVSVASHTAPREQWRAGGWEIRDAGKDSATVERYREFIQQSRGELSVAKNTYVDTRCGWFSCRTACYLAAGRPAVVQDTGWSEFLPAGDGLLAFDDEAGAVAALRTVENNYVRHSQAAAEIATKHLDHARVLGELLDTINAPRP